MDIRKNYIPHQAYPSDNIQVIDASWRFDDSSAGIKIMAEYDENQENSHYGPAIFLTLWKRGLHRRTYEFLANDIQTFMNNMQDVLDDSTGRTHFTDRFGDTVKVVRDNSVENEEYTFISYGEDKNDDSFTIEVTRETIIDVLDSMEHILYQLI